MTDFRTVTGSWLAGAGCQAAPSPGTREPGKASVRVVFSARDVPPADRARSVVRLPDYRAVRKDAVLDAPERVVRETDEHEHEERDPDAPQVGEIEIEKEIGDRSQKTVRREGPLPFSDFGRWHADRYSVS